MAWEMFDSCGHKRYDDKYGEVWKTRPCVVLTKRGVLCNKLFTETFSFKAKDIVNVSFDSKRKKLALHRPVTNEAALAAYKMQPYSSASLILCRKAAEKFPDSVETAFAAVLNTSEKIIEVQIS